MQTGTMLYHCMRTYAGIVQCNIASGLNVKRCMSVINNVDDRINIEFDFDRTEPIKSKSIVIILHRIYRQRTRRLRLAILTFHKGNPTDDASRSTCCLGLVQFLPERYSNTFPVLNVIKAGVNWGTCTIVTWGVYYRILSTPLGRRCLISRRQECGEINCCRSEDTARTGRKGPSRSSIVGTSNVA